MNGQVGKSTCVGDTLSETIRARDSQSASAARKVLERNGRRTWLGSGRLGEGCGSWQARAGVPRKLRQRVVRRRFSYVKPSVQKG